MSKIDWKKEAENFASFKVGAFLQASSGEGFIKIADDDCLHLSDFMCNLITGELVHFSYAVGLVEIYIS